MLCKCNMRKGKVSGHAKLIWKSLPFLSAYIFYQAECLQCCYASSLSPFFTHTFTHTHTETQSWLRPFNALGHTRVTFEEITLDRRQWNKRPTERLTHNPSWVCVVFVFTLFNGFGLYNVLSFSKFINKCKLIYSNYGNYGHYAHADVTQNFSVAPKVTYKLLVQLSATC